MHSIDKVDQVFAPLWEDIDAVPTYPDRRPLLAHYTSIETLEKVMANNEIWFSNPLFMNDFEELRFGINEGARCFFTHEGIRNACVDADQYKVIERAFEYQLDKISNKDSFDTYVFCASEHDAGDTDGLLSMWRGYGANGVGAAIIFDTSQIAPKDGSPFILSKVVYASTEERIKWINEKLNLFAKLLRENTIPKELLYVTTHQLLERIKIFSLFTKHHGFLEEREWRIVYLRERHTSELAEKMLDYVVGKQGIEPKLKVKGDHLKTFIGEDFEFEKIISNIILGPSLASPLAVAAIKRMLEKVGKSELQNKVSVSSTPFRMT